MAQQIQQQLNNIVDEIDLYNVGGHLAAALNHMGYYANTTTVPVKEHPYDITKCVWKEGLEIYKPQLENITRVLDILKINYEVRILQKKTFPIIIIDNGFYDFQLLLKNINLIPIIGEL